MRDVLFPYAREHLAAFIAERRGQSEIEAALAEVTQLARAEGADSEDPLQTLQRWMAQDRKATPLEALQWMLWEAAFQRGTFRAHIYGDLPGTLARWRQRGLALHLLVRLGACTAGVLPSLVGGCSLTLLLAGWFDTASGSKLESESYARIARRIGRQPGELAFLSDARAELDAARAAGLTTVGLLRQPYELGGPPRRPAWMSYPSRSSSWRATVTSRAGHGPPAGTSLLAWLPSAS